jgi:hypothetical protein
MYLHTRRNKTPLSEEDLKKKDTVATPARD